MNILNVGYQSTNYYAIDSKEGKLLVDCGWPGTLPLFSAVCKRKGFSIQDISYLLVTHFHPDHAGLAQELKNLGVKLILPEVQIAFLPRLREFFQRKPSYSYVPIEETGNLVMKLDESRDFLAGLELNGEILHTPGHTDDSVSLLLDEGFVFTGDLSPRFMIPEEDDVSRGSWDKIYNHRISRLFPAHGNG